MRLFPAPTALAAALAAALTAPAPAPAQADLTDLTEAERGAFRSEVRDYLLENPEVLMEAIAVLETRAAEEERARDRALVAEHRDDLFGGDHWVGGNPDGDITLVEFMDYRCSYCRRAYGEVAELLEQDGNIRFMLVEYPILGEQSTLAARFALAVREIAGDNAYEQAHDALMLMRADVTEPSLRTLAEELDLDFAEVASAMASGSVTRTIAQNRQLGAELEISGTPSFVMENTLLRGFLPYEEMAAVVNEIRGSAE